MKSFVIGLFLASILLFGCSSQNEDETKQSLLECYESQCNLGMEGVDEHFEYPISGRCYYESRKECVLKAQDILNSEFCDDFKYTYLCHEDAAVLHKDMSICTEQIKNAEEDVFFHENCKNYYETSIKTVEQGISHCAKDSQGTFGSIQCYSDLISDFKSVDDCNVYIDLLESNDVGETEFHGSKVNKCVWWYAAINEDISICTSLTEELEHDFCVKGYAFAKHDSQFCEDIKDTGIKDACLSAADKKYELCSDYHGVEICVPDPANLFPPR